MSFSSADKFKTYTKCPESKHDDDEVNRVSEEHQHIDVGDCAVLWMNQVIEKLPHGKIDTQNPTGSRISVIRKRSNRRLKLFAFVTFLRLCHFIRNLLQSFTY